MIMRGRVRDIICVVMLLLMAAAYATDPVAVRPASQGATSLAIGEQLLGPPPMPAASNAAGLGATGQSSQANVVTAIQPLYVHPLMPIESGRNESNPSWSPDGNLIAFERSREDKKDIMIARTDGTIVRDIYFKLNEGRGGNAFFFPGVSDETSYNAGITWSPTGNRVVFMSNGGEGNYDLYLTDFGGTTTRLTYNRQKDGHANWSPTNDQLVFVSGRSGEGDLYLLNLAPRVLTRLTWGHRPFLYPQWSPDGRRIAMVHGSNANHHIYVIDDITRPRQTLHPLTTWAYDDLRPIWSPDGSKIAFYSNYNKDNDPKTWSIIVVAADGSDPKEGNGLAAKVVATNVVADVERGPVWMPDSNRIVYAKNDSKAYNPNYIVDLLHHTNLPLETGTKMNHDIACSSRGVLAFRAQVNQWDQIFVAGLQN